MLRFRLATPADADALADLNYRTFVEEIPQHAPNAARRLVDAYDAENTYVVAEHVPGDASCDASGDGAPARPRLVGMICVRDRRPFSLDRKLDRLDDFLPPGRVPCEVRLLSVDPAYRTGAVFRGLVQTLADEGLRRGYDLVLISGTTRQLRLYRHLGFEAFGPLVGTADAAFQPMQLTLERFRAHADLFALPPDALAAPPPPSPDAPATFLPGPVALWPSVAEALALPPVSHRSAAFLDEMDALRRRLCRLAGAPRVQVLVGSGTLANDVVAGQLAALGTPGLVLAAGAFGERLVDHTRRWGLAHAAVRKPWGEAFTAADLGAALDAHPEAAWVWTVHLETSTGVLHPLPELAEACAARGVRLALDAVSSLGTAPVDLSGVWMAAATSGKGLGALAGLALVFHHDAPDAFGADDGAGRTALPRYLDLAAYDRAEGGVAYTQSSPLVRALAAALQGHGGSAHLARVAADTAWLRPRLAALGGALVGDADHAATGVVTFAPPDGVCPLALGDALADAGYLVSYRSGYLLARGWLQVCLMGDYPRAHLPGLLARLEACLDADAGVRSDAVAA